LAVVFTGIILTLGKKTNLSTGIKFEFNEVNGWKRLPLVKVGCLPRNETKKYSQAIDHVALETTPKKLLPDSEKQRLQKYFEDKAAKGNVGIRWRMIYSRTNDSEQSCKGGRQEYNCRIIGKKRYCFYDAVWKQIEYLEIPESNLPTTKTITYGGLFYNDDISSEWRLASSAKGFSCMHTGTDPIPDAKKRKEVEAKIRNMIPNGSIIYKIRYAGKRIYGGGKFTCPAGQTETGYTEQIWVKVLPIKEKPDHGDPKKSPINGGNEGNDSRVDCDMSCQINKLFAQISPHMGYILMGLAALIIIPLILRIVR